MTLMVDDSLQAVVERSARPGLGIRESFAITRKSDPQDETSDEVVLRTEWFTATHGSDLGFELRGLSSTRERLHTTGSSAVAQELFDATAERAGADPNALVFALQGLQAEARGSGGGVDGLLACAVSNLASLASHTSPDELRRSSVRRASTSL